MSFNYEDIKNSIKESGKLIYWYTEDGRLLVVDSSKKASRKKLLKTKYEGNLYRFSITFHRGEKFGQGGELAVHCRHFKVEDGKIIKITQYNKNGTIWFRKRWLEAQRKWDDHFLERIIRGFNQGFKFGFGIYIFPI
jgi:hypothetical protein